MDLVRIVTATIKRSPSPHFHARRLMRTRPPRLISPLRDFASPPMTMVLFGVSWCYEEGAQESSFVCHVSWPLHPAVVSLSLSLGFDNGTQVP